MIEVKGEWINDVLRLVQSKTTIGDEQLTLLAVTLVVACRSCKVERDTLFPILDQMFESGIKLEPLS